MGASNIKLLSRVGLIRSNGQVPLTLKVINNSLAVSTIVRSINQKVVAVVENNKLIVEKGFSQKITEQYFEIKDEYNVPVLQIILDKNTNSIKLNGVFLSDSSYMILSDKGTSTSSFDKPFLLMNEMEKNAAINEILTIAKKIQPLN